MKMGKTKQLTPYFPHDANARNDSRIIRLRIRHGAAGYGVYFMLLERLREETYYTSALDYEMIAFDLRVDTELVRSVVEDFGLFCINDDRFYSASLSGRMEYVSSNGNRKSETYRANANSRWSTKSEAECNCIGNGMQLHEESDAIAPESECNCIDKGMQLHEESDAIASITECNCIDNGMQLHPKPRPKENKIKENKIISPPYPPQGGRGGDIASLEGPPQDDISRNYDGLVTELNRIGCSRAEVEEICRLSNFGQIGHPAWRYVLQCVGSIDKSTKDPSRIRVPGRYIIRKLQEELSAEQQPP